MNYGQDDRNEKELVIQSPQLENRHLIHYNSMSKYTVLKCKRDWWKMITATVKQTKIADRISTYYYKL